MSTDCLRLQKKKKIVMFILSVDGFVVWYTDFILFALNNWLC